MPQIYSEPVKRELVSAHLKSVTLLALLVGAALSAARRPDATGYMYSYYVPPSASTPWRPAWSPDGTEIAFSMSGSIWKIRVGDTTARELTAGRTYDSSPAWSPDGRWIVYTAEDERGINLMLLNAATGESAPLSTGDAMHLDPAWSHDGKHLAYVRGQTKEPFSIYVLPIDNGKAGKPVRITDEHSFGHERLYFGTLDDHIQPAWSPDGSELLLVSNRGIAFGSGAIWRAKPAPDCMRNARMILREETLYRTQPQWSPDGKRILYSSHRGSQYDNLYLLPADGGEPYQLTHGDWDHFDARWSPDGEWIAYISNQHGISDLRLLRIVGGEERIVDIRQRAYRRPMGKLEVEANEPARYYITASDGKTYAPADAFQRVPTQGTSTSDYFHAARHFVVDLPVGSATITAVKGIEYTPLPQTVKIRADEATPLRVDMRRMIHMNAFGWYSGVDHTHMNYGGDLHNTPENMMFMGAAEDLNVLADKICNKDNRIFDWQYFTGAPSKLSTRDRILRFDEEYRPPFYGHINLANLTRHLISPFTTGYEQTAIESLYPSNTDIFRIAHEQGAIGGYVHPWTEEPSTVKYNVARGFPVDLALGASDYLEVLTWSYAFTHTAPVWHRALNCGFKVPASAGEDSINGLNASRLLGTGRMYVYCGRELTWDRWVDGIRRGHTFVTNGPLLQFTVNGELPGGEIHLPAAGGEVEIAGRVDSIVPLDRMEVYFNGAVIQTVPLRDGKQGEIRRRVPVTRSGWLTLRAIHDKPQFPVDDKYIVGETSPVYVYCGDRPIRSREDAEYFVRWIDDITRQAEAHPGWRSDRERKHVLDQFAEARQIWVDRSKESH